MNNDSNIIIYQSGEIELKVSLKNETVWLRQNEITLLFDRDRTVITRHINNILRDKEVDEKSNVQKMHIPNSDKPVKLYSLDIILAVGYRTNSAKAIKFRQWATKILKDYILNGYAINSERITQQRFKELENDVVLLKHQVSDISKTIEDKNKTPTQGIFFNGQIFDAYKFVSDLVRSAGKSIILLDNYIDDTVLTLFSKRKKHVNVSIYTRTISKQLALDLKKFNDQYEPVDIKEFKNAHDRFLIVDDKEIYHFGASLKDLGKKLFAFSKFDNKALEILTKLK
ncbi:MAG: DNA-binding protein [Bacteroidetes bacterium 4484_249]|nr:MAG: DNA-binding protein [Bacteroidetes bacterium 4484_249]